VKLAIGWEAVRPPPVPAPADPRDRGVGGHAQCAIDPTQRLLVRRAQMLADYAEQVGASADVQEALP
jgi:hypothetical protein